LLLKILVQLFHKTHNQLIVTGSGGLPTTPYSGIAEWDSLTEVQPKTGVSFSEL
jgi:hypothetical protein